MVEVYILLHIQIKGQKSNLNQNNINLNISQTQFLNVNQFINDPNLENINAYTSKNIMLETKTIDFGNPSTRKSIYYIDISYRIALTGDPGFGVITLLKFQAIVDKNIMDLYLPSESFDPVGLVNTQGLFATKRYYFSYNKKPIKGKTIALKISPVGPSDDFGFLLHSFSINDIGITFRTLNR